jgi:hypothetical protein
LIVMKKFRDFRVILNWNNLQIERFESLNEDLFLIMDLLVWYVVGLMRINDRLLTFSLYL